MSIHEPFNPMQAELVASSHNHNYAAHMNLWSAVFVDGMKQAVAAYRRWACEQHKSSDPRSMTAYPELAWVITEEFHGPGSFVWLCELFNVDPGMARKTWLKNQQEKLCNARPTQAELEQFFSSSSAPDASPQVSAPAAQPDHQPAPRPKGKKSAPPSTTKTAKRASTCAVLASQ